MPSYKFPTPGNSKVKHGAAFCEADRMLALYNQAHGTDRKRITGNIKEWFADEARKQGWAGGHFPTDAQTGHTAGCVLFQPSERIGTTIKIKDTTLLLEAETGMED